MNKYIKQLLKLAFFSIALVSPIHAADLEPLDVKDFSCGLVTAYDPTIIDNGCMQQGWNIDVWTGRIQKRRGSLLQNSTTLGSYAQPVRFLKEFPDQSGNKWLIAVSSASIFKSNNSGAINSVLSSSYGFTTSSEFQGINAFGKVRLVDGSTNSIIFDGNTVTTSTATPRGSVMAFMFERVFVANVSGANSTLFLSRFGDPEDWTDDGLADNDAFQLFIRQNDGYPIRAVVPYGNEALVFKDRSIDAVTMDNSGLVPIVTSISNNIGTSQPKSIQVRNNDVIFMGADGFYSLMGNSLSNISLGIKPTFDTVLQKNSASRSFTETSQVDFQGGTSQGLSPNISPNSLVLSTAQVLDTSTGDFVQGTIGTNNSTTSVVGSVVLSGAFENFLDNNYSTNPVWNLYTTTPTVANGRVTWNNGGAGSFLIATCTISQNQVVIFDNESHGDNIVYGRIIISTFPITAASGEFSRSYASFVGNTIVLDIGNLDSYLVAVGSKTALSFTTAGSQVKFGISIYTSSVSFRGDTLGNLATITGGIATTYSYIAIGVSGGASASPSASSPVSFSNIFIDNGQVTTAGDFASHIPTSSTFTSRNYPLSANGVWYGSATFNSTLNNSTVTYAVYGGSNTSIDLTNNSTWLSSATVIQTQNNTSTGAFVLSNSSTVFYTVNMVRSATATAFNLVYPAFNDAQVDYRYSSGTYLGQNISLSNISAFSVFLENHNINSGSLSFNIYSDTNSAITPSNPGTFIASQTIANNSVPAISTANFGRVLYSASITSYFQNPQLLDYTVSWLQGSANFPVASLFFEGDYLAAVSTKSTSANDTILVYDRNNHWSMYTGINCYSLALYNQQAYCGDSGTGNIYRIQVDNLYSDNGASIYSFWKSKEFDFGYPMTDKTMRKYFAIAKYNATSTLTFAYGVNRGLTTSSSLSLSSTSGFFRQVIAPSSLTYYRGITHSFSISNNVVNQYFDFLAIEMWPRLETPPGP